VAERQEKTDAIAADADVGASDKVETFAVCVTGTRMVTRMVHSRGSLAWVTLMDHSHGSLAWVIRMVHSHLCSWTATETPLFAVLVGPSCHPLKGIAP
jgi:hypothetical protein